MKRNERPKIVGHRPGQGITIARVQSVCFPGGFKKAMTALRKVMGSDSSTLRELLRHEATLLWMFRTFVARSRATYWFTLGEYQQGANDHRPVSGETRVLPYGPASIATRLRRLVAAGLLRQEDKIYRLINH